MRRAPNLERSCTATPEEVRRLLIALDDFLDGLADKTVPAEDLRIVAGEVLNNVAEHAYDTCEAGPVRFRCVLRPKGFLCRVEDIGRELGEMPEGKTPDLSGPLPEGGFGWFLIYQLAEGVRYRRRGARNQLSFTIPRATTNSTHAAKQP